MREAVDQGFGDAVAEVISIGISTHIGEGEHGNGINLRCSVRPHIPRSAYCQSYGGEASGYNPKLSTFELPVRRCICENNSGRLGLAFQTLEVSQQVECVLVTNVAILFQCLVDHPLHLRGHFRVEAYWRSGCS